MNLNSEYGDFQRCNFLHFNGDIKKDLLLNAVLGYEALSQGYTYELTCYTLREGDSLNELHGREVSFNLINESAGLPEMTVHGMITDIRHYYDENYHAICIIKVEPQLTQLGLTLTTRIWKDITAIDIVLDILNAHGIKNVEAKLSQSYIKREFCMQYRESDLSFINRLLESEGVYYYFTHNKVSHTLVLVDNSSAHNHASQPAFSYDNRQSLVKAGGVTHWRSSAATSAGKYALSGYSYVRAKEIDESLSSVNVGVTNRDLTWQDISASSCREALSRSVKLKAETMESNARIYHADVNAYWLHSGEIFTLSGHNTDDGDYRIQSVTLKANNNLDNHSGEFACSLTAQPHKSQWRSPVITPVPHIAGVLIATVVGPASEEIHTDEMGRIKIKFPWDNEGKNDGANSCWVSVMQPWAGNAHGSQFIPRIGTEVVVSFIQGNPDYPLVIGSTYNGMNNPPFSLPEDKSLSGIVTRSTGGNSENKGHKLIFDDKVGQEKITLYSQRDFNLTIENNALFEVKGSKKTIIDGEREIMTSKGNNVISVEKGNYSLDLKKGDFKQSVVGNVSYQVNNGNFLLENSTGKVSIKSENACCIESSKEIVFKVGSNKITLSQTGITVNGAMVKINATGTAEIKSAMTTVEGSGMNRIKGGIINIG